ncbi:MULTISPECIES: hypothetical protein [Mesorhizobium]|uniref:hypothetical protein n=1 Tax=Mesorhizobium TaxID=68287 RepID=UPI000BAF6539|nr:MULTISPECIES: hypothetical protein [Mesorhizobium]TGV84662.1 hypothetical protein EN801_030465 [Mesorhizobium sp. M00.F.Ca.ET.158.01.1.1]PBB29332.1 hypothetical protein CK214_26360 [Mesorhizobium sp. WSM3882]PBB31679.1 hypothetical protein CK221_26840 [Mesorhizobium sp. WSM3868]PBB40523.1 hypothetical protein CK222_27980 [Mesorhizobium sp. WSM3866]PBB58564.1 hypothetical protein CK217_29490 [Mesorhizobium loti]
MITSFQSTAEQLNEVPQRHSVTLGMDGLYAHLGCDCSGSFQKFRMLIILLPTQPSAFALNKCLLFQLIPKGLT